MYFTGGKTDLFLPSLHFNQINLNHTQINYLVCSIPVAMPSVTLVYNHPYDNEISGQVNYSFLWFTSFFTGWMLS